MTLFYLVRHGEADYSQMMESGFFGFGRDFASLSKIGIEQVEKTAKDERLKKPLPWQMSFMKIKAFILMVSS